MEQWQILGTLVFGAGEDHAAIAGPHWRAEEPPPLFECLPNAFNQWTIDIPQECAPALLQRIRESMQARDEPDTI